MAQAAAEAAVGDGGGVLDVNALGEVLEGSVRFGGGAGCRGEGLSAREGWEGRGRGDVRSAGWGSAGRARVVELRRKAAASQRREEVRILSIVVEAIEFRADDRLDLRREAVVKEDELWQTGY